MTTSIETETLNTSNLDSFIAELETMKKEIKNNIGIDDYKHLRKIEFFGRLFTFMGYATAWVPFNFFSALFIGIGNFARWAMVTHHVSHKGYDKIDGIPKRYHSKFFAKSYRRYIDWFDWILPAAWDYEHNILHHYRTGEIEDPDLIEYSVEMIRKSNQPILLKYSLLVFFAMTWKFTYYTPSTLLELQRKRIRDNEKFTESEKSLELKKIPNILALFFLKNKYSLEVWIRCILPYISIRFGIIPACFLLISPEAYVWVLIESILAEIFANVHSFIMIAPNHAGSDIYRFDTKYKTKAEFCFRQIIGTANYSTGNEVINFLHGYLNYQIEHHIWPELPMLKYKEYQARVQALCGKYNIPYKKENVFLRLRKMSKIFTGGESMKREFSMQRAT